MSSSHTERPAPTPAAKVWGFLGNHVPTFAPFGAALFIIVAYLFFYAAFANCSRFSAGCKTVAIVALLKERGWCPPGAAVAAQSPQTQTTAPTPAPTPAVTVKTEGGGAAPQVTVQVIMPPAPTAAPAPTPTQTEREAAVYSGRLSWVFLYAVSMIASLCALTASVWVIWSSLRERPGRRKAAAVLLVTLLVGVAAGGAAWRFTNEGDTPVLVPLIECLVRQDVGSALGVVGFGNATALGLAFVLLLASCATLWPIEKPTEAAVAEIVSRMRYLRILLYVGMVALVVNVLRLRALFNWALSFLPPPDGSRVAKILAEITTNVTSSEAASYTLLLAAIYVPAVLVLRRRARALIKPGDGSTQAVGDEWLEEHGLNVTGSLATLWPRLAAIVAPLLVGSLGELFKGLSSIHQ